MLDVGIGLEINVLTSKFILLGDQMLGEMGCHPEICFYPIQLRKILKGLRMVNVEIELYKLLDLDLWMSILLDVGNGLEFTI